MKLLFLKDEDGREVAINTTMVTHVQGWALPIGNACPDEKKRGNPRSTINFSGKGWITVEGSVETIAHEIRMHRNE